MIAAVGGALFVELKWHPVTNWFRAQDWRWTGLSEYTAKRTEEKDPKGQVIKITEEVQAGKTGWDYFQLAGAVAVPIVLGFGGFWLNQQEQRRVEAREEQDQKRAEANLTLERQRAEENIREEALQTYLDRISELLLSNNLGKPYPENNPAQDIARARTLTVLERLDKDGERKGAILRFLYEAELLKGDKPVVDLSKANLNQANLFYANLTKANLTDANLTKANLIGANLEQANLTDADLFQTTYKDSTSNNPTSFPRGFDPEKAGMRKVD